MIDNSLFRLAGILYSNINIEGMEPSSDRMLLEIIESLFIENNNKAISVSDVYKNIREEFQLTFHDKEILNILKNNIEYFNFVGAKDKNDALSRRSKSSIIFNLEEDRYNIIKNISNTFDFKKIVKEFWKNNETLFDTKFNFDSVNKLLTEFIYNNFVNNLNNLGVIFNEDPKKLLSIHSIGGTDTHYTPDEIKLINIFLNYENPNKDKLIFYIMTLSFEYITAVNNSSTTDKKFVLGNKEMFVDTNVFYRALGFNGEERKEKTLLFFEKCKQIGQQLFIMDITYNELISSIEKRFNHLSSDIISTHSKNLQCLYSNQDPEYYYFEENKKDSTLTPLIFSAIKVSEFKNMLKKYNVKQIYSNKNIILEKNDYDIIRKFVDEKNRPFKSLSSDFLVIKNIKKIISDNDKDIFFITTDKLVQRIDKENIDGPNICLRPSNWLSYALRYVNRTDNDYRSFVSFFNLNSYPERKMPSDFINKFLNFIKQADISDDNKSVLIESLCEQRFDDIITAPEDEQEELFVAMSNSILEEKLCEIKKEKERLYNISEEKETELQNIKNTLEEKDKELINNKEKNEHLKIIVENHSSKIKKQAEQIKNQNKEIEKINNIIAISKYKNQLYILYTLSIISSISIIYFVFFSKTTINYMNKILEINPWGFNIICGIFVAIIFPVFVGFLYKNIMSIKNRIQELK